MIDIREPYGISKSIISGIIRATTCAFSLGSFLLSSREFLIVLLPGLTATGLKKDQIFVGDKSTVYKSDKTIVDVKIDTNSHVSTKVIFGPMANLKTSVSFKVPDQKFDVQYLHPNAAIDAGVSLNPTPLLEFSAANGSKDVSWVEKFGSNGPDFSVAVLLVDKDQTIYKSLVYPEYDSKTINASPKFGLALALKP